MTSLSSLLFISLLASTVVFTTSFDFKLPYDYKFVCDANRYGKLGLTMSLFPFCNQSLSYDTRAKNLISSMTLPEKALQLGNNWGQWFDIARGVERLGLPPYNWWSEALHGVASTGGGSSFDGPVIKAATSFPTPITTAAAFNESLWKEIGTAVSTEARAMNNHGVGGLTFWSPNINVARDPRWGRTLETPGEDPFVVGRYAVNFVRGLQDIEGDETTVHDPNTRPLKVSACCKHYAAYDMDDWRTFGSMHVDRFTYNANVTERDMVESYLKPFEMCVKDGDVSSVMCSYNGINGIPICADAKILRGTIRGDWDFHGYIVSDCDSVKTIVEKQHFMHDTPLEGTAQVMRAGLDLDCGPYYPNHLEETVKQGLIKESDVDQALFNNYMVLLRLGWFDGNSKFDSLNASDVCSPANIGLATSAARQGMVLLKNRNHSLPLDPKIFKNVAVVGPHANVTKPMIGNYAGEPCRYISPIDGLRTYAESIDYFVGCADIACHEEKFIFHAMSAASTADATIIVAGLDLTIEAEERDRSDINLPGYQSQMIERVAKVSKGPVVLVILSAGGVDISSHVKSDDVDGIIWAGYPGQDGGQAIADVVYGAYNPGGRLPMTWYPSEYLWKLPITSQQFRPDDELGYPGRTYKFYNGSTIFPFGFGLSYTNFTYNFTSTQFFVNKNILGSKHCHNSLTYDDRRITSIPACQSAIVGDLDCSGDDVTVEVSVKNVGKVDGSDVVMLYAKHPEGLVGAPIKHVVGFQRVFLKAGSSEIVKFKLDSCKSFGFVTESAYEVLPQGEHKLVVGDKETSFYVQLQKKNSG